MSNQTLLDARNKKGLSQLEVARIAGIAQPTYANSERGRRSPSVGVAKRLGEALGIAWYLIFEKQ